MSKTDFREYICCIFKNKQQNIYINLLETEITAKNKNNAQLKLGMLRKILEQANILIEIVFCMLSLFLCNHSSRLGTDCINFHKKLVENLSLHLISVFPNFNLRYCTNSWWNLNLVCGWYSMPRGLLYTNSLYKLYVWDHYPDKTTKCCLKEVFVHVETNWTLGF